MAGRTLAEATDMGGVHPATARQRLRALVADRLAPVAHVGSAGALIASAASIGSEQPGYARPAPRSRRLTRLVSALRGRVWVSEGTRKKLT